MSVRRLRAERAPGGTDGHWQSYTAAMLLVWESSEKCHLLQSCFKELLMQQTPSRIVFDYFVSINSATSNDWTTKCFALPLLMQEIADEILDGSLYRMNEGIKLSPQHKNFFVYNINF